MKHKLLSLALTGVMVLSAKSARPMEIKQEHHQYPMAFVVSELEYQVDAVHMLDANDHEWVFIGIEDWCEGDLVAAIMDDHGTPDYVYDDDIVQVRYAGWVNRWMQ